MVFVGSFRPTFDGRGGGQLTACRNLVAETGSKIEWICVDTTQASVVPPPLVNRAKRGVTRLMELAKLLRSAKPDAVLIFSSIGSFSLLEKGAMVLICRAFGRKTLLSLRSNIKQEVGLIEKTLLTLVTRIASRVLVQSELAQHKLETVYGLSSAQIRVLRNMHPPVQSSPHSDDYTGGPDSVVVDHADTATSTVILYAGWLEPVKAVNYLIDAVAELVAEGQQVQLVICGSGSEQDKLEAQVNHHGMAQAVQFLGWLEADQLSSQLQQADIFCLPSLSEGQPNAVLEAMCHGLPIVAADVDGLRAIITHDMTGLLVKPASAPALKRALQRLLEEGQLVAKLGSKANEYVRQYHSPAAVTEVFYSLLIELLPSEKFTLGDSG